MAFNSRGGYIWKWVTFFFSKFRKTKFFFFFFFYEMFLPKNSRRNRVNWNLLSLDNSLRVLKLIQTWLVVLLMWKLRISDNLKTPVHWFWTCWTNDSEVQVFAHLCNFLYCFDIILFLTFLHRQSKMHFQASSHNFWSVFVFVHDNQWR